MLRRMMANNPTAFNDLTAERDSKTKQPFKVDPNALRLASDNKVLFGGGFRAEYDFILNNYTRPQFTARNDLSTAYTDARAAAYAKYKTDDSGVQVHETVSTGRQVGRAATVNENQYMNDVKAQSSAMVNQARQEFFQEHQKRDIVANQTAQGQAEVKSLGGIDDLGLRPNRNQKISDIKPYQNEVRAINQSIDDSLAQKKAENKEAEVKTYSVSIEQFDKFLDSIWPSGATKQN